MSTPVTTGPRFYLPHPSQPERDIKINFNPRQVELLKLMASPDITDVMAYGSAGGGKTFGIATGQMLYALKYPFSKHFVARYSLTSCKRSLWRQTYLPILKTIQANGLCTINMAESHVEFVNGASISCIGLQPSDVENSSLLSLEWDTGFIGEANENPYSTLEFVRTRMRGTRLGGKPARLWLDLNPTTFDHWTYQAYIKGVNPENNLKLTDFDYYASLQFKTDHNPILHPRYILSLDNLSANKKRRFRDGEFGHGTDAFFDEPNMFKELPADMVLFAYNDPAFSQKKPKKRAKNKQPDYSALCIGGRHEGKLYIVTGYIWRSKIAASYDFIEKVCKHWGVRKLYYEDNQARGSIGYELKKRGMSTKGIWHYREKHTRIDQDLDNNWDRVLWSEEFKTNKEMRPFYNQVMSYSEKDSVNDDAPDAAAGLAENVLDKVEQRHRLGQYGTAGDE